MNTALSKLNGLYPYIIAIAFMVLLTSLVSTQAVSASTITIPGGSGEGNVDDIKEILYNWIGNIRMIGGVVIVIAIVLAGILIGVSMGNAAKRAVGVSALISAVIGIILVMKAPDIANYIIQEAVSDASSSS